MEAGHDADRARGPAAEEEFERGGGARFDGMSYLYLHPDVRRELGADPEGAFRHWRLEGRAQDRAPSGLARRRPRRFDPGRFAARPFGMTVWGPFEAVSGLGTAARNLAAAVRRSGIPHEFRPYDVETGHALLAEEADRTRPARFRVNLVLANADQIRRVAALHDDAVWDDSYTIAVWAWELAAFRPDWLAAAALVDEVWTNSRFELDALAASALSVPIHLMPLPVPCPAGGPERRRAGRLLFGVPEHAFVALCPFDPGSTEARKNPRAGIRAFREAFGTDMRRILLVKHHGGSPALHRDLAAETGGAPNIRLIGARLDADDMALLQAASDVVLSPHRSEGFGLNIAEMQASGAVAVATDYSGSRDFLDAGTGFPVAHVLVPIERRAGPYLEGALWAEPDPDDLVRQLRRAAGDAPERARRGLAARERMAASFSPDAIGARIGDRLHALGLDRADGGRTPDIAGRRDDTAGASFVPRPESGATRFPTLLPLLSLAVDADGDGGEAVVGALRRQSYPFWEVLLHRAAPWPAPEDAASRAALRPFGDLRVRLVRRLPEAGGPPPDAASGHAFVLPADAAVWLADPAALLGAARCLGEGVSRIAGGGPGAEAAVDVASLDADGTPFRLAASRLLRADTAEWLVLAFGDAAAAPSGPILIGQLRAAPFPPGTGAVFAVRGRDDEDALFLTTRSALRRVVSLEPGPEIGDGVDGLVALFRRAGLRTGALACSAADAAPPPSRPAMAGGADLARHVEIVRRSGLFDPEHYAAHAPDVAASGTDLVRHYCEHGWRENRAPNFYLDPAWYRRRHMSAAPAPADPLLHWIAHRRSGVRPSPLFDPAFVRWTLHLHPDEDPLAAFLARRRDQDVAPVPGFDAAYYRRARRDMAYRRTDPFEHYIRHGAAEGANPSAAFDTVFYRERFLPGALGRRVNPLLHWLENQDRPGLVVNAHEALRARMEDERARGARAIDVDFSWYDGLPQGIETLRALLSDPSLDALPFRPVLRNEALASRPGLDPRQAALIRSPYDDPDEDEDLCARLHECLLDRRALRDGTGAALLGVAEGGETARALGWAERLAARLGRRYALAVVPVAVGVGT